MIRIIRGGLEALFEAVPVEDSPKPKQKKEDLDKEIQSVFTNPANEKVVDFKDRIKGLQSEADAAIVKKSKENGNSSEDVAKNNQSSSETSGLLTNQSEDTIEAKVPLLEKLNKIFRSHSVEALFERRTIKTISYIETNSEVSLMQLKLFGVSGLILLRNGP